MKPLNAILYLLHKYSPFAGNVHIPSEILCSKPIIPITPKYYGWLWNCCTCHGVLFILKPECNNKPFLCDCSHHCRSCRYTKRLTLSTKTKTKWLLDKKCNFKFATKETMENNEYIYHDLDLTLLNEYEKGKGTEINSSFSVYTCKHCSCPIIAIKKDSDDIGYYYNNSINYESDIDIEEHYYSAMNRYKC